MEIVKQIEGFNRITNAHSLHVYWHSLEYFVISVNTLAKYDKFIIRSASKQSENLILFKNNVLKSV